MEISLNGIVIDWVRSVPENFSAEVTEHTILDTGKTIRKDISSHIHVENRSISLQCILKDSFFSEDKTRRFRQLHDMAQNKQIITMASTGFSLMTLSGSYSKYDEEFAIVEITENERGEDFIDFNLTLRAVNFTTSKTVKTSIQPDKSLAMKAAKGKMKQSGDKGIKVSSESYGTQEGGSWTL